MSTSASGEAPVDNECLDKYELLASWWALLSTGASREAPVDNECLGKSKQVGGSGETWNISYWQLG